MPRNIFETGVHKIAEKLAKVLGPIGGQDKGPSHESERERKQMFGRLIQANKSRRGLRGREGGRKG